MSGRFQVHSLVEKRNWYLAYPQAAEDTRREDEWQDNNLAQQFKEWNPYQQKQELKEELSARAEVSKKQIEQKMKVNKEKAAKKMEDIKAKMALRMSNIYRAPA